MKKLNFIFTAIFFCAIPCFAQYTPGGNTDYGGLEKDTPGIGSDVPFFGASSENTGFGSEALGLPTQTLGSNLFGNTAVGCNALFKLPTGANGPNTESGNTAIGAFSLYSLNFGFQNTATGYASQYFDSVGYNNCAYGYNVLEYNNGNDNCGMGVGALHVNAAGVNNVAIGFQSQNQGQASDNTSVGYQSLFSATPAGSQYNVAIGEFALYDNTTGIKNTGTGESALYHNISGRYNTANGYEALLRNGTGHSNTAVGNEALAANTTGWSNIVVGSWSMYLGNNTGDRNVAIGDSVMIANTNGYANVAIGNTAMLPNTTGHRNVAIGGGSMASNTTGSYNTGCGWSALDNTINGINNTATGAGSLIFLAAGSSNTADGNDALYHNLVSGNTAVGDSALYANTTGAENVAVGYQAATAAARAHKLTAVGYRALFKDTTSNNTAVGDSCLFNNTSGINNTAIGIKALYKNTWGYWNTATGEDALYSNTTAHGNVADGYVALYSNITGIFNTGVGFWSLSLDSASYNTGLGMGTLYNNTRGTYNLAAGYAAGSVSTTASGITALGSLALFKNTGSFNTAVGDSTLYGNITGTYNSALGYQAGPPTGAGGLVYATAIGANSEVVSNHAIILGGTHVRPSPNPTIIDNVGIGMSGIPQGPLNRLEISYYSNPLIPEFCARPDTSTFLAPRCPDSLPTGASGLRFRDLTDASRPYPFDTMHHGFLSLDDSGNVVYMAAGGNGTGFGPCGSLPNLTTDEGINLDSNNLYFVGNQKGNKVNNIAIGPHCGSIIPAKLYVFENGGSNSTAPSIGERVVNNDAPICSTTNIFQPNVIGIQSVLPAVTLNHTSKVAGWFEADNSYNCCSAAIGPQYAVYVPRNGGNVAIGYIWNTSMIGPNYQTCPSTFLLSVNGTCHNTTGLWTSDSTLKTNVHSIAASANPLSIIKQLNGVSFNYIDSIITDSGVAGTHYGFIAQKVERVLPNVVRTDNNGIKALAYTEIIPWLVEGMKQQQQMINADSIHIHNDSLSIDSLKQRFDSLYSYINSIKNCLNQLCPTNPAGGGSGPAGGGVIRPGGNQSDGTDSPNTQEVTLSSANTPLLYQNTPNPFSTGTKINYYLPQGTMGAVIVFYDSYGTQIKEVQLSQTGNGTLNISPDNLPNGIYSYSLVVNGNVIDTKRMVLQK